MPCPSEQPNVAVARQLWRRRRARSVSFRAPAGANRAVAFVCAISVLAVLALGGCGSSEDGVGTFVVDPAHYSLYACKDLIARLKVLRTRERDLRNLMDRANDGGGGAVIGTLAYRTDYETVLGEQKVLQRTAAEKKCDLVPIYQSDQTIR